MTSATGDVTYVKAERRAEAERVSLPELSALVQRFEVSPSLMAIQLNQAGLISDARKNNWMALSTQTLASRFGWSDQYHALQEENTRRAPQRLLSRAIQGYVANTVSLQTVARLRGVAVELVTKEFSEAGIAPDIVAPAAFPPVAKAEDRRPDTDFSDLDEFDEFDEVTDANHVFGEAADVPKRGAGASDE